MKAEKHAQQSFKAKRKKRVMAAKVVQGFIIFNCVFGVLIIQLLKTVYGALLIYVMFF